MHRKPTLGRLVLYFLTSPDLPLPTLPEISSISASTVASGHSGGLDTATQRILVIVPTFNEARNIEGLLKRLMGLHPPVTALVIDDNSPDGTAALVQALQPQHPERIHLLQRTGKLGLGTAYRAGFDFALSNGYELICQIDADFSHDPRDIPRLVAAVNAGADLAIGSRYIEGIRIMNWPLSRLILSYGAGVYTRFITRMPIRDVTAGFKCYHRRVLEGIDLNRVRSNGYSFQVEMHYRAWKQSFKIVELPIIFTERVEGTSKMNRAIIREAMFKVWELRLRALFNRL